MRAQKDPAERQEKRKLKTAQGIIGNKPPNLTPEAKAYVKQLSEDPNVTATELAGITQLMRERPDVAKIAITKSLQSAEAQVTAHLAKSIKDARISFTERARDYVEIHLKATRAAYAAGEFETAAKHAEWAMEKIGTKNLRLIEMPEESAQANGGPRIMVGVKIGGQQPVVVDGNPDE